MSSKKAMKQAQKQAFAKHRSNITNNRFSYKKRIFPTQKKIKINSLFEKFSIFLQFDIVEMPSSLLITVFILIIGLFFSNNN
jgi:hypothetical protein